MDDDNSVQGEESAEENTDSDGDDGRSDGGDGRSDGEDGMEGNSREGVQQDKRRKQISDAGRRAYSRARNAIIAEETEARSWRPKQVQKVEPSVGIMLSCRWQCEQFCRAYVAYLGVQHGVNVRKNAVKVSMLCKAVSCPSNMVFDWQPSCGRWKLNRFHPHLDSCLGNDTTGGGGGGKNCAAAYTAEQVARLLKSEIAQNPNITAKHIAGIVKAKGIYTRQPPPYHYRAVLKVLRSEMAKSRAIQMAAMEGFADLLRDEGHYVKIIIVSGSEMKTIRRKAAEFIFRQCKLSGTIGKDEQFDVECVKTDDIKDNGRYYGGFIFVPSCARHFIQTARLTTCADAAHCQGVGPQSYGTVFQVLGYDTNNHILPLVFAHFVGTECRDTWLPVFRACAALEGYDVPKRVCIVDQEKSIDSSFNEVFHHASIFLDKHHVVKNMTPTLGAEKSWGVRLYEKALRAPSVDSVNAMKAQYGQKMSSYLSKFPDKELYRACSALEDLVTTSQGAESSMAAALRTQIRAVEPQSMLEKVALMQRSRFLAQKKDASQCDRPVPPRVAQHIGKILLRAREYQGSVRFIDGTDAMEATVQSASDSSQLRHVVLNKEPQIPPSCCAFSQNGDGFPCYHGAAVIAEKYGALNMWKFVHIRHLTATWKSQYHNVSYTIPPQYKVDSVLEKAKSEVDSGDAIQVPKALAPPRGRPTKNAGKRYKGWYEKGPMFKKTKSHSCSICAASDHIASACALNQLFNDPDDDVFM